MSLNSYFHPMLKKGARVSILSYNAVINTGTSLPFRIVSQKMFSSPVLAKNKPRSRYTNQ